MGVLTLTINDGHIDITEVLGNSEEAYALEEALNELIERRKWVRAWLS